jgi:hypothetical protein
MPGAEYYREQAETLRKLATATSDQDTALGYNMRAIECDYLAERAEAGGRGRSTPDQPVRQHQIQPENPGDKL